MTPLFTDDVATSDLDAIFDYYEIKAGLQTLDRIKADIYATFDALEFSPRIGQRIGAQSANVEQRKFTTERYHFVILYSYDSARIVVNSIFRRQNRLPR